VGETSPERLFAGAMTDETIGLEEVGDGLWNIV
jgi:hypothetical protein